MTVPSATPGVLLVAILAWLVCLTGLMLGITVAGLEILADVPITRALINGGKTMASTVGLGVVIAGTIAAWRAVTR